MRKLRKMGGNTTPFSGRAIVILCLFALLNGSCGPGGEVPNADQLFTEGKALRQKGKYREALERFERVLTASEKAGEMQRMAKVLRSIGDIHTAQANYAEAHRRYVRALEIEREIGDKSGIATTLNDLGESYRIQGNYDESLRYYHRSLSM